MSDAYGIEARRPRPAWKRGLVHASPVRRLVLPVAWRL